MINIKKILLGVIISIISVISGYLNYIQITQYDSLYGLTIIIDPGHGGNDNGASYEDVLEDEINLNISNKIVELCLGLDMNASIIRVGDYDLSEQYSSNHKAQDLQRRVDYINKVHPNILISIHLNSYERDTTVRGAMVYYKKNHTESYIFADNLLKSLNLLSGFQKKLHYGDFYILNKVNCCSVFVECGFISNNEDRQLLLDEQYQQNFAKAIMEGIKNYYLK